MSRRHRKHAHANHERWLVSYADFITLLFAFFVVLYASSQVDNKKIAQVSAAIEGAFQDLGVFSGNAPGPVLRAEAAPPGSGAASLDAPAMERLTNAKRLEGIGGGYGPDINRLKHDLEQALGEQIKKHEIDMRVTPEGLVVSLREVGFFNSGDATLLSDGEGTLTRIATILNAKGFQIRVEGHTDNVPIHTGRFRSNWELSVARATEVVSLLIEQHGFDPKQVSAAGFSEYHPIASNKTEEGRKTNRRVDLVIVARTQRESEAAGRSFGQ
ncbi:MAG: OmpA family protein [Acidobacteriia bacterium]|nr:OmpA family protein [Terriglobia bacterium]